MSRHDPDDYGNFAKYQLHTDGSSVSLVCEDCTFRDELHIVMEWASLPVNLADVVKEASKHETEMDRAE